MIARTLFFLSDRICFTSVLIVALLVLSSANVGAITLTGSNGRAAEILGIKDATPKGLTAQMVVDGPIIGIPWSKLDLAALERDQKLIFAAYKRAEAGETIPLNLGSFGEKVESPEMVEDESEKPQPRYRGWADTKVGERVFALQMPLGEPRGILLISAGEYGGSLSLVTGWERGDGPWAEFQTKYGLAVLSYDLEFTSRNPREIDSFVFAEKGSGQQVLTAIASLATQTNQPGLVDLPIAVCGMDRTGAAFAYHFVLWKPEKILGAVISKGGFYNAEPGEEAAKVPMIFVWGQYSNNHELWGNENSAEHILEKYRDMKPNWTSAMEFKGNGRQNQYSEHFARVGLKAILDDRLPEPGAMSKPEPEPEPKAEPKEEGEGGKPAAEDEEPEVVVAEVPLRILPFDRSKGKFGNLKTGEVISIVDPDAVLAENETFVINAKLAGPWKQFLSGEFEVPED